MIIRGRGTRRSQGSGRNQLQPSPMRGVHIDRNKRQKLRMVDALKHKQKFTYDFEDLYDDIEDEEKELIKEKNYQRKLLKHQTIDVAYNVKQCKGVSFGFSNNMGQSSRRIIHSQGRGHSDQPEPSQSCTSPVPPPPHASFCRGVPIHDNSHVGTDEYYAYNDGEENDGEEEERQLIKEKENQQQSLKQQGVDVAYNVKKCKGVSFEFSNNMRQSSRRIIHSQGRGHSGQPELSQSCTSPAPPPPHASFSRGI